MPGQRRAGARRARGSRALRIAGAGVVLLLAGTGVIASLVAGKPHVTSRHLALPAKVEGVQEVGLVNAGPPPPQAGAAGGAAAGAPGGAAATATTLLKSSSGLAFAPVRQPAPEWTADQMADGTYIFIYISDGTCLSSASGPGPAGHGSAGHGPGERSPAVAERCNLGYAQRWRRQQADSRGYWQLRNLGDGRCLSLGNPDRAGGQGGVSADLASCGAQQDWRQRITFSPVY